MCWRTANGKAKCVSEKRKETQNLLVKRKKKCWRRIKVGKKRIKKRK